MSEQLSNQLFVGYLDMRELGGAKIKIEELLTFFSAKIHSGIHVF
jgi:hypothetical protein